MAKLTEKQRKFVLYYEGNATEAATKAGYSPKSANVTGSKLLTNANIKKAINDKIARSEVVQKNLREELYTFWRMMVKDADGDNNRLKASELLAKAEAMFVQKVEDVTNYNDLPEEEVIIAVLLELESRGYRIIPPK